MQTQSRVLTLDEILQVVKYHDFWRRRNSPSVQQRLAVFRLSCCQALRCVEIRGLNLGDFFFESAAPFIRIRKDITKGHKNRRTGETIRRPRKVSLTVDSGSRESLKKWYAFRMEQSGGDLNAPFICGQTPKYLGKRLRLNSIADIWLSSIRCLGRDRVRATRIHSGRHTCLTHLAARVPLAVVKEFAGHSNIRTTSHYLHAGDVSNVELELFAPKAKDEKQSKIDDLLALLCLEAGEISEGQAARKMGLKRVDVRQYRHDLIREFLVAQRPLAVAAG